MIFTNIDEYLETADQRNYFVSDHSSGLGKLQVVATSGAFDILTPGHMELFEYCRRLGTYVVVLLNTDASIQRYKSEHRPVKPWKDRAVILDSLRHVEHVIGFDEDDPIDAINKLKPDVWVKGNRPVEEVVESSTVLACGGVYISLWTDFKQSSTNYIQKAAEIYLAETSETGLEEG